MELGRSHEGVALNQQLMKRSVDGVRDSVYEMEDQIKELMKNAGQSAPVAE